MNVQPYELGSVRNKRAWQGIADKLDLHITIVKEAFFGRWFVGLDAGDFINLVNSGEITRDEVVESADCFMEFPFEELDRREDEADKWSKESDFSDLLQYRLKKLIQIGDYIVSDETKTYCFSKQQYQTKGKKYKITDLSEWKCGLTGFSVTTTSDIKGERIHWSNYGVRSVWRKGKEIWNWNLAYLELFKEQNPNHPETQEMIDHCTMQAEKCRTGERD